MLVRGDNHELMSKYTNTFGEATSSTGDYPILLGFSECPQGLLFLPPVPMVHLAYSQLLPRSLVYNGLYAMPLCLSVLSWLGL